MKKGNGAFAAFMRGISDCSLMVSKEDLATVEQVMRSEGMDESQIAIQKKFNYKKRFLRYCRRATCSDRVQQLRRFDNFITTFSDIKDAKTQEVLIRPKTLRKIEAVGLDIASGYYIDPTNIDMFSERGRDAQGRMIHRSRRGSSDLEVCNLATKRKFLVF